MFHYTAAPSTFTKSASSKSFFIVLAIISDIPSDEYKTDVNWGLEFEDGTIATIYNWKNGKNYCGERGLPVEDITEWHIGGHEPRVASWVEDYLYHSWPAFDDIRQEAQY